ncbi:hypothetical protein CW745_15970 [Psychromonas sp. psych-6C06]|uniref:threonine/serine exporter family protein n=1 Tax=Psychromonas sp. psych-6C06 TaxID=2058089 RepID=UPI000C33C043|nr:threonine/serine exporter family protein [Psychromonas sp. psych-6C06]PKF60257.1 hypothetical protein CW745_15970 [Psychromonas sp. psych-6C06]
MNKDTHLQPLQEDILSFADRLHKSGCAPRSVAKYTQAYAQKKQVELSIDVTPTKMITVFEGEHQRVVIQDKKPPSVNLRDLIATLSCLSDDRPYCDAKSYSNSTLCIANILMPPCYLMLVGSTYIAVMIAALLGFIAWAAQNLLTGERAILVEFFVALCASFTVGLLASQLPELPILALCIASIVLFIPGLTVTNALMSLAINDFRSGIELLAQSALVGIKIFIGVVLGLSLSKLLVDYTAATNFVNEIPLALHIMALIVISIGVGIIFNANFSDIIIGLPVAAVGMWGPHWFTSDWVIGTWISTMIITLYGLLAGRIRKVPALVYIILGIIVLVPGSRILVGASESFFATAILPIPNIGLSALLMFCAIVAGQIMVYSIFSERFFSSIKS